MILNKHHQQAIYRNGDTLNITTNRLLNRNNLAKIYTAIKTNTNDNKTTTKLRLANNMTKSFTTNGVGCQLERNKK